MRQHSLMMRVARVESIDLNDSGGSVTEERMRRSRGWMW